MTGSAELDGRDLAGRGAPGREVGGALRGLGPVWTIPNVISFVRLLCVPLFVYLLFGREHRAAAAWLLGVLGMTDWVDGYLARRLDQVSELGKLLDPVADRLALVVGIAAILVDGSAPLWFGLVVLAREVLVSVAGLALGALGARRIDVTWWGKTGTFFLYFAFPMWLGASSTLSYALFLGWAAWAFALPGLAASYYSAGQYVPLGVEAYRAGRAGTRTDSVGRVRAPH
ncbi:MAG: CDP-alcohol phosphatidyltransferase family protein [Acidimicrobiia bacterium]|nr:CDP-alcohol phosphatidyltransferase family protein [Acidimicrobiia bacterium]